MTDDPIRSEETENRVASHVDYRGYGHRWRTESASADRSFDRRDELSFRRHHGITMNRRAFLSVAVAGTTAASGCLARSGSVSRRGRTGSGDHVQKPEPVDSIRFSITDQSGPLYPPRIEFDPPTRRVRITGRLEAGNPCKETNLKAVEYDGQADELSVLVAVRKILFSWGCPDSLGIDTYEVVIAFDARLPETVTATHRDFQGETSTTTASPSA